MKKQPDPTEEEIAQRAAEIRRGWCDENGVIRSGPGANAGHQSASEQRSLGIRIIRFADLSPRWTPGTD